MTPQDVAKRAAAAAAIERFVRPGMRLGLGSGSTSFAMVRILGERVRDGLKVVGVATSQATAELAREEGVPLADLDALGALDLTLDGADEIDPGLRMIKGGGACLLWEKIIAAASGSMVAMVDETKLVDRLGAFPLPVEVIPMGWTSTCRHIEQCLAQHRLEGRAITRRGGDDPLLTDSGNYILDCHLQRIADPEALERSLDQIPGVVENGLFCNIAQAMIVGYPDGTVKEVGRA